jgi:hypothetical protein
MTLKHKQQEQAIEECLELYTLEEILEHNDLLVSELLLRLLQDGTITLPEVEPL